MISVRLKSQLYVRWISQWSLLGGYHNGLCEVDITMISVRLKSQLYVRWISQ